MQHVIKNVPNNGTSYAIRKHVRSLSGTDSTTLPITMKGRGPRPSRRYHASLPAAMATHFSMYIGHCTPKKVYWDYKGIKAGKLHLQLVVA